MAVQGAARPCLQRFFVGAKLARDGDLRDANAGKLGSYKSPKSGFEEHQQVFVELILMGIGQTMRRARIHLQRRALD